MKHIVDARKIQERARFIQNIYDSELITDFDLERRTDYDPADKTDYFQGTDITRICEESEKVLNILLINICGLKSKLKAPDLEETISHHNMIVLIETKLDDLDFIHLNNIKLINNNRKYRKTASGGVAVLVHNSISSYVTEMDIQFKDTLWILMSKTFHGKPLVIGVIYSPPEGSPYADPTVFDFIEETIADIKGKDESTNLQDIHTSTHRYKQKAI